jgi:hypothetical protein
MQISGDDVSVQFQNNNLATVYLVYSWLNWEDTFDPDQYVNYFQWNGSTIYNGDDYSPSTSASSNASFSGNGNWDTWHADFNGIPSEIGLNGDFTLKLTFDLGTGEECIKTVTGHRTAPTTTPTRTPKPTDTPTSTPTNTPLPTKTPTPTKTPVAPDTPTPTKTPLPSNTPTKTPWPTQGGGG